MVSEGQADESVIHFVCGHCNTPLTVDASLAGVTGPCPSCGQEITAPAAPEPQSIEIRPREIKRRDLPPDKPLPEVKKPSGTPDSSHLERRQRRRSVNPSTGLSEAHQEKMEVAAVVKMLIAGLVVLGLVLVIAWWLNAQFAN